MFCSELCVPVVQSLGLHKKLKFGRRAAVSGSKEKFNKAKATSVATSAVIRAFVLFKKLLQINAFHQNFRTACS